MPAAQDREWYHVGLMTDGEVLEAVKGPPEKRRIPYTPDDPKPINQAPYIAFAKKDRTPKYQQEEAR